MTDRVSIIADTSTDSVEVITIQDGIVVVTEDQGSESFHIIENAGAIIDVIDQNGGGSLGGVPVVIGNPQIGDVVSFDGVAFRNRRQIELTDGGNF